MQSKSTPRFIASAVLTLTLTVIATRLMADKPSAAAPAANGSTRESAETPVPHLPKVHLDGTYFAREGKRFIPVGAHWVPAKAAMQWPLQWDPKDIEADFAKMHQLGYSMVRFDLLWAWFEPRPGDYNPVAFQQLNYLVS